MKPDKPKTLDETVEAVHEAAKDSDILDEVLAMKSEQVDAELAKAGVDVEALDARLATREAEVRRAEAPATSSLTHHVRMVSRKVASMVAAATFAVGGAGGYVLETLMAASRAMPPTFAGAPAEDVRSKAFEACGRGHWRQCLDELDKAKAQDPDGDVQPEVQDARARAQAVLHR